MKNIMSHFGELLYIDHREKHDKNKSGSGIDDDIINKI
jgi:hypothetical protein